MRSAIPLFLEELFVGRCCHFALNLQYGEVQNRVFLIIGLLIINVQAHLRLFMLPLS